MGLKNYLEEILTKQKEIGYSFPNSLNLPGTLNQIEKAEFDLGFSFSEQLKELYLFADGTKNSIESGSDDCMIPLHKFLGLEQALKYYKDAFKVEAYYKELFLIWDTDYLPGKHLFPFLADDVHCFWLDLNKSSKNYSRIFVSGYAGESPQYQFISLEVLFQVIAESYKRGIYSIEEIFKGTEYKRAWLTCDFVRYGQLCQELNPDIDYWKVVTETWRHHIADRQPL